MRTMARFLISKLSLNRGFYSTRHGYVWPVAAPTYRVVYFTWDLSLWDGVTSTSALNIGTR